MTDFCAINKNSKYQTLKQMSGASTLDLDTAVSFVEQNLQREPQLDDIRGGDSENYLVNNLGLKHSKDTYYINTKELLSNTGTTSLQEANIRLNEIYKDKEITLSEVSGITIVDIKPRPSAFIDELQEDIEVDLEVSPERNLAVLKSMCSKLERLYGIHFNLMDTESLEKSGLHTAVANSQLIAGFVYNGEIYINTDVASIDTPIHELSHFVLGALKFQNPILYQGLTQSIEQLPNYAQLASRFQNRTRNDINEEIYVEEVSKALLGKKSGLDQLGLGLKNEIIYNAQRLLDSVLSGQKSVKTIPRNNLFSKSLVEIAELVGSKATSLTDISFTDLSYLNRIVANTKEQLLESGELTEICQ